MNELIYAKEKEIEKLCSMKLSEIRLKYPHDCYYFSGKKGKEWEYYMALWERTIKIKAELLQNKENEKWLNG